MRARRALKRTVDIVIAAVALVVLAPLMLLIAASVWKFMGAPVLFRQQRPGLHGKPFCLVKFRSMKIIDERSGESAADGDRLEGFGRWLRSSSLDELPELWNVLRGDMSVVGPRPLLMEYLPLYSARQARRHDVRPGLTGWAQINGRNASTWGERFELDVWYVDNHDFGLDLQIMLRTVAVVITRKGVSQSGHATMDRFRGNLG